MPTTIVPLADVRTRANVRENLGDLAGLAASIRARGLLQPPIVYPNGHGPDGRGYYTKVGHRRVEAARLAGLTHVEVVVVEPPTEAGRILDQLAENTHRADLNPLEEADAFAALQAQGLSQKDVAERHGVSEAYVSQTLALRRLTPELQQAVADGRLSRSAAEQLTRLDQAQQAEVAPAAIARRTVRRVKELVDGALAMRCPSPQRGDHGPCAVAEQGRGERVSNDLDLDPLWLVAQEDAAAAVRHLRAIADTATLLDEPLPAAVRECLSAAQTLLTELR